MGAQAAARATAERPRRSDARRNREAVVRAATEIFAEKGLQETSFSAVLDRTGAPRGSIYHHFPDGKDQLVALAVDRAGESALAVMEQTAGRPAAVPLPRLAS